MGSTHPRMTLVLAVLVAAGLLPLAGCGSKLPATASTTGTVLYRGEPVEGAVVVFSRGSGKLAEGEMALGKTDAKGRFQLTTHVGGQTDVKGATPGEYQVTISKRVPPPGMSQSEYQALVDAAQKANEAGPAPPNAKQPPELVEQFPPRYSVLGKSELKANVTAKGPNDFQFKLE